MKQILIAQSNGVNVLMDKRVANYPTAQPVGC